MAGAYGCTERTLAYWNLVHGAPLLLTAKQLRISEDTIGSFYQRGRCICVADVVRREKALVFGGRHPWTTDIELDEHAWRSWVDGDRHYYFVWIGIQQRGSPEHLFLRPLESSDPGMPPGVVYSEGQGRVPPLTSACLDKCLGEAFTEDTLAILMSDSALAYQHLKVGVHGIRGKYLVDHSNDEYKRDVMDIVSNVETLEQRCGTAGTQLLDGTWKRLEDSNQSHAAVVERFDGGSFGSCSGGSDSST